MHDSLEQTFLINVHYRVALLVLLVSKLFNIVSNISTLVPSSNATSNFVHCSFV